MSKIIQKKSGKSQIPYISLVIPLLNEEESLMELFSHIKETMRKISKSYEVIFIDDGSTDKSFKILSALHSENPSVVKAIRFRRNYGKSAALSAGFKEAKGELIITMDADLQDDPEEIPLLIDALGSSYDLVSGWKKKRHDSAVFTIPSRIANALTSKLTGLRIHDLNCGLKIYRQEVVKELKIYGDLYRYIPILVHQAGFRVGEKTVHHHPRKYGRSKYTIGKFYRGFLDLLTILFTAKYIRRPLHLFGIWGIISFIIGVAIDGYLSIQWLMDLTSLSNRPLFMVGFLFIIIGVQFVSLGLLGEMISRHERNDESYSIREVLR
ncbi:MAG: glycosyltransferase family 2 protein [Bacteroidetes bacterium]|nr:glycosyltransferase family 2 protein [Bacteroidota bacterium]